MLKYRDLVENSYYYTNMYWVNSVSFSDTVVAVGKTPLILDAQTKQIYFEKRKTHTNNLEQFKIEKFWVRYLWPPPSCHLRFVSCVSHEPGNHKSSQRKQTKCTNRHAESMHTLSYLPTQNSSSTWNEQKKLQEIGKQWTGKLLYFQFQDNRGCNALPKIPVPPW